MSVGEQTKDQTKWDSYGLETLEAIRRDPSAYVIEESPLAGLAEWPAIERAIAPLEGRRILELGCGRGRFSVWMAKRGALVTAVDVGPNLIAAARLIAETNGVAATFTLADITSLPFEDGSFDTVVGIAVLHHLAKVDMAAAVREAARVLRPGGVAVFREPIEDSAVFSFMQNLIPAGRRGSRDYRPSLLSGRAWRTYVAEAEDRTLTAKEVRAAGTDFHETVIRRFGLLVRLERLVGRGARPRLMAVDRVLLARLPFLGRYSQTVLVEYRKALQSPPSGS